MPSWSREFLRVLQESCFPDRKEACAELSAERAARGWSGHTSPNFSTARLSLEEVQEQRSLRRQAWEMAVEAASLPPTLSVLVNDCGWFHQSCHHRHGLTLAISPLKQSWFTPESYRVYMSVTSRMFLYENHDPLTI